MVVLVPSVVRLPEGSFFVVVLGAVTAGAMTEEMVEVLGVSPCGGLYRSAVPAEILPQQRESSKPVMLA